MCQRQQHPKSSTYVKLLLKPPVTGKFNSEVANWDTGLVVVKVSESVDMDNLVVEADVNGKFSINTHIYVLYSENGIYSCLISTY